MRSTLAILITLMISVSAFPAETESPHRVRGIEMDGEIIPYFALRGVYCFANRKDMSRFNKLVYNVKKVYPVAQEAERLLEEIERNVENYKSPKGQKAYIKKMEKQLTEEYTPVLKNMTFSQGKILIKLLDRQTDKTGYAIVKELRGGFRASIYQGIARIFGANLKDNYDKEGEDQIIEEIIEMVEMGLL